MSIYRSAGVAKQQEFIVEALKTVVESSGNGLWLVYEPTYLGVDTEAEYESVRTADQGGDECFALTESQLSRLLRAGALGLDWTDLYFFRGKERTHLHELKCSENSVRVADMTIWEIVVDDASTASALALQGFGGDAHSFAWKPRFPPCGGEPA